ncbi:S-DNA-T family DNA segregation ATPase FtsK/SpoIIIE [Motilibacter rhizosphaerae]|uniref:S-DNA-T family DNA segregation ATPase FtsK/SpoIIIE n=1 Tax=Motilibacter rhizosphaerae TaxID=598652 RepID=A0A4Q7NTM9_9ACTN|nr:type VII secretion protein EccCa [Motilibacter rhizosphaerae]RZS90374.1 S-DNA-T family DNA segregation ATPase FtsK/SpoIIIE [Motilibacter rhizosphaerae]
MTTTTFRRPPRQEPPELPGGEVPLITPPQVPVVRQGLGQLMTLLPMVAGAAAMAFMYAGRGGGALTYVVGGMFGVSMLGMVATSIGRPGAGKRAELDDDRRDYLRYLAQVRRQARATAEQQRRALDWRHPEPGALWRTASGPRLWERRPADDDFLVVRVGRGPQRLARPLLAPETAPFEDLEPLSASALRRLVRAHSTVPDLPLSVAVRAFTRIDLVGEVPRTAATARALVAQLVAFHPPEEVAVWLCLSPERTSDWEWAKWLPHVQHPTQADGAGPVRMLAGSLGDLEAKVPGMLAERPRWSPGAQLAPDEPHVVVVVDGGQLGGDLLESPLDGVLGVTLVVLRSRSGLAGELRGLETDRSRLRLVVGERERAERSRSRGAGPGRRRPVPPAPVLPEDRALGVVGAGAAVEPLGTADELSVPEAEALARLLAPVRLASGADEEEPLASDLGLTELLGLGDPEQVDVSRTWRPRAVRERLRVPLGVDELRAPVDLDLKESALEGMGPHGLLIGATGSGKSELLRTLVLGLAITHSSETLNFVLVDFKGGATFAGMADLPHTSAVITNLSDDLTMVDRMRDALQGEMVRRQELLRAAGRFASVRDYERAREAGAPLAPLPSLLVVCDEFSELLSAKPDFIDLFVAIGRLGRSLGIHLLLASQRLEEGRLRGLDSHLSYRIALRTFSAAESRVVIGVPDAYELPPVPGSGYLKIDTTTMVRFKAAYVSGPVRARTEQRAAPTGRVRSVLPWSLHPVEAALAAREEVPEEAPAEREATPETLLDVVVERLRDAGPPAHQVWLPPLSEPVPLDDLLPPLSVEPGRGLTATGWEGAGALRVPVGVVDRPLEQRRDLLLADLSGAAGHVAVVGGPQSGKSTLIRTLVLSLALTHTPREVQVYALDLGGGALAGLAGLPHVGGIAPRLDAERVRRTLAEVGSLLAAREALFTERGIASAADFRSRRAAGELPEEQHGDVFLVIDGWGTLRQDYEGLEAHVTAIAARGLNFGLHVVLSATRWADVRPAMRDLVGTRYELRLGDPTESETDRRAAAQVPADRPGRGLTRDGAHAFLAALPRTDGSPTVEDLSDAAAQAVADVAAAWQGPAAPPVRLLPSRVLVPELPPLPPTAPPRALALGVREADLGPVWLDPDADPHFLCFGDVESGKTDVLRVLLQGIQQRYTPDEARILLVDYRRTLLDVAGGPHVLSYATSGAALGPVVAEVRGSMQRRLPGPDVRPEQLRDRSWWHGPELFVVVDDYDLVVTPSDNPLAPLAEFLPQARDIGLHLLLARRSGGAGRSLFEPVLARLREAGSPGLVLSGSRDEGALVGDVRPSPQPPGRGTLVSRRTGAQLVQAALAPGQ